MQDKKQYKVIGMMSGTSLDGIDLAYCKFTYLNQWKYVIQAAETYPYTEQVIRFIKTMEQVSTTFIQFKKIEIKYSIYLSQIIKKFIRQYKIIQIDFISIHGHTIFHQPQHKITIQAGNLSTLAAELKINVIGNFRQLDVMSGGEGAPLAPYGEQLFGDFLFLNLGGIANIGYKQIGWDIYYCNLIFNYYAGLIEGKEFDIDGKIGRRGDFVIDINQYLTKQLKNNDLRSLGREGFQNLIDQIQTKFFNHKNQDILNTFYRYIAKAIHFATLKILQISQKNDKLRPNIQNRKKVVCTGGGAKNKFLLELLKMQSNSIEYLLPDEKIIDFKEAVIFAFLGVKYIEGIQNCGKGIGGYLVKGIGHKIIENRQ